MKIIKKIAPILLGGTLLFSNANLALAESNDYQGVEASITKVSGDHFVLSADIWFDITNPNPRPSHLFVYAGGDGTYYHVKIVEFPFAATTTKWSGSMNFSCTAEKRTGEYTYDMKELTVGFNHSGQEVSYSAVTLPEALQGHGEIMCTVMQNEMN